MEALLVGLSLGLGAGFSPGPLLTLVISATLERGFGAGLRVAASPLVTDTPIVVVTLVFLSQVPQGFLTALTIVGGVVVVLLGIDTWRGADQTVSVDEEPGQAPNDFLRGALVNMLSPHPWLAWMTVLGPLLVATWQKSPPIAAGFLVLFYIGLVGSKVAVAGLVAAGRGRLDGRGYRIVLQICGTVLVVLGLLLVAQGLRG